MILSLAPNCEEAAFGHLSYSNHTRPIKIIGLEKEAMLDDYNALITNGTWVLVHRLANVNVVRSMWLFKHKFNADGSLSMYKARLVANRHSQQQGIDCDETFSLVVKPATIHTALSLVVSRDWPIHQHDVKNAFLHGHLYETVYMHQPPGFVDPNKPNYVCHLQRSLYGLKQASHDIILTASSSAFLQRIIASLHKEILERAHMQKCNPCRTPVDTESKLGSDDDPVNYPTLYHSLAGALQYLTFRRPDLSYVVQQLHVSSTTQLSAYTDADWAGCPVIRRSTSGYCVFLGDNLLSWSAKRRVTLSCSSVEAEYRGVANVVAETAWIRNLLCELHTPLFTATLVYCDNVSAVYLSTNHVQHQRTKHIEIDIHFVRDYVASGQVRVLHVPSRFQYADIFTKGLPTALIFEF
nr:ribonuclease H-like domain-containing protein [Tanacetum cinerariifolium]